MFSLFKLANPVQVIINNKSRTLINSVRLCIIFLSLFFENISLFELIYRHWL